MKGKTKRLDYSAKFIRDSRKQLDNNEIIHVWNKYNDLITALDNEIVKRNMQVSKKIYTQYTVYK